MPQINVASSIGGFSGVGAGVASGGAALAAGATGIAAGAAVAGIGAAVAALVVLLMRLFPGADPNEAIAANLQQIFEVASVNLEALAGGPVNGQWGSRQASPPLISPEEAAAGIQAFQQSCIQYEAQAAKSTGDMRPFQNGVNAITAELDNALAAVSNYPSFSPSGPVNLTQAHSYYVPQGTAGFMRKGQGNAAVVDSIQAAWQVTDGYLQTLDRSVPQIVSNAVSTLGNVIGSTVTSLLGGTGSSATGQAVTSAIKANPVLTVGVVVAAILLLRKVFL